MRFTHILVAAAVCLLARSDSASAAVKDNSLKQTPSSIGHSTHALPVENTKRFLRVQNSESDDNEEERMPGGFYPTFIWKKKWEEHKKKLRRRSRSHKKRSSRTRAN
ncbi:RxLR effector protein [Phytophthora megakarya]|uniref:RxLR effector protein n=1 Tax=Phytophthora megakarya TaxID=4795 RepID=A0A225UHB7_9STRA|nr:RxLR effector protein [Phytophthora megakarya]